MKIQEYDTSKESVDSHVGIYIRAPCLTHISSENIPRGLYLKQGNNGVYLDKIDINSSAGRLHRSTFYLSSTLLISMTFLLLPCRRVVCYK